MSMCNVMELGTGESPNVQNGDGVEKSTETATGEKLLSAFKVPPCTLAPKVFTGVVKQLGAITHGAWYSRPSIKSCRGALRTRGVGTWVCWSRLRVSRNWIQTSCYRRFLSPLPRAPLPVSMPNARKILHRTQIQNIYSGFCLVAPADLVLAQRRQ